MIFTRSSAPELAEMIEAVRRPSCVLQKISDASSHWTTRSRQALRRMEQAGGGCEVSAVDRGRTAEFGADEGRGRGIEGEIRGGDENVIRITLAGIGR